MKMTDDEKAIISSYPYTRFRWQDFQNFAQHKHGYSQGRTTHLLKKALESGLIRKPSRGFYIKNEMEVTC